MLLSRAARSGLACGRCRRVYACAWQKRPCCHSLPPCVSSLQCGPLPAPHCRRCSKAWLFGKVADPGVGYTPEELAELAEEETEEEAEGEGGVAEWGEAEGEGAAEPALGEAAEAPGVEEGGEGQQEQQERPGEYVLLREADE